MIYKICWPSVEHLLRSGPKWQTDQVIHWASPAKNYRKYLKSHVGWVWCHTNTICAESVVTEWHMLEQKLKVSFIKHADFVLRLLLIMNDQKHNIYIGNKCRASCVMGCCLFGSNTFVNITDMIWCSIKAPGFQDLSTICWIEVHHTGCLIAWILIWWRFPVDANRSVCRIIIELLSSFSVSVPLAAALNCFKMSRTSYSQFPGGLGHFSGHADYEHKHRLAPIWRQINL